MEPLEYLHLQLRLEGNEVVQECFLHQVEVVPGEEVPLMLIVQLAKREWVAYYAEYIFPDLQKELAARIHEIEFPKIEPLLNILEQRNIQFDVGHYKTYVFPSMPGNDSAVSCFSKEDPKARAFGFEGFAGNVYAIEQDDRIVSTCVSTRENKKCGEAWVYTSPEYRHHGFAQRVASAWAKSLMDVGKIPFYSHKIENLASANLAKKLNVQPMFEEIAIQQM
jgi:RimJ/RimL family protein N-acetyltransferase